MHRRACTNAFTFIARLVGPQLHAMPRPYWQACCVGAWRLQPCQPSVSLTQTKSLNTVLAPQTQQTATAVCKWSSICCAPSRASATSSCWAGSILPTRQQLMSCPGRLVGYVMATMLVHGVYGNVPSVHFGLAKALFQISAARLKAGHSIRRRCSRLADSRHQRARCTSNERVHRYVEGACWNFVIT